ncbi:MAG: SGNH/GDSL hydrolase family protein, partial [Terriglobales bacterium]
LHGRVTVWSLAAAVLCLAVIGYVVRLASTPVHRFGSAVTLKPGAFEENYTRRGKHTYHMNSFGFRGPEWSAAKPSGTIRGVVIGDSMVFGAGVDAEDTIDAALGRWLRQAHAETTIEILNLGVPGTNLPGYVELYRAAVERLRPDFVVICLFLPNDLGELEQPWEENRLGAYSFFHFLLGNNNNPYTFYAMRKSESRSDDSKLAFLTHYVDAMETIRRSSPSAPALFLFLYADSGSRWTDAIRARLGAGAAVVDHAPFPDIDFIPGDGHPMPDRNRQFAEIIGQAIDRSANSPSYLGHSP